MESSAKIQDLLTLAKLILPYHAFQSSSIDNSPDSMTEEEGREALHELGISIVSADDTFVVGEANHVVDFSGHYDFDEEFKRENFYYINNPDGTMRWVFPESLKYPTFLSFYNASSFKAKTMAWLIKLAFKMGLKSLVCSGSFQIHSKIKPHFMRYVYPNQVDNYSIFMGTVGPNRKIIIELNKGEETKQFIKIALNKNTKSLIKNEFNVLDQIENLNLEHTKTPYSFIFNDDRALMQPSLLNQSSIRSNDWTEIHTEAKIEQEERTISNNQSVSKFVFNLRAKIRPILQNHGADPTLKVLAEKVEKLCSGISIKSDFIPTSLCHNDFTPWNMYLDNEKLHVYDWELAGKAPVLSDVFHFHIQKGVMMEKKSYAQISQEILQCLENPSWKSFIKKNEINVPFQYSMYLANTVAYYLEVYDKQESLHWQAKSLLKIWNLALDETIAWNHQHSFRQQFIFTFFESIKTKNYAYLKFIYKSLSAIPVSSDLDILIDKADLKNTISIIENSVLVKKVKLVRKSFMTTAHIYLKDESFLSIDLLTEFKQTNRMMLDAKEVLNERQMVDGIFVPNPKHDFEYCLMFYHLNGSDIPTRYRDHFSNIQPKIKKNIGLYICNKYFLGPLSLEEIYLQNGKILQSIEDEVSSMSKNVGFYAIFNNVLYILDTIIDKINNRGFTLTVSGVDGAGKSTIITEIKQLLEAKYRKKVVVLRHRPSVLPILSAWVHGKEKAEKLSTERLPRTGQNQSKLKSLFRFGYYLIDYLFGQFYVYFKYILRGKVVVYDRYYFDFIIDAKRTNIVINPLIPKVFYSMVHKPELNIFLYAPSEEILKRKQELNAEEIESLTDSYKTLFGELSKKRNKSEYLTIKNIHLKETLNTIDLEITKVA